MSRIKKWMKAGLLGMGALVAPISAFAGSAMPWDTPITDIKSSLQGPVAGGFVTIAIIATGLMWSFGEHGSSMRKVAGIGAGGSMALGGATAVSDLTGQSTTSGAVIGLHAASQVPGALSVALLSIGMGFYVFASAKFFIDRHKRREAATTERSVVS
ncbi:TrbC/VirB2 family protein [Acidithiobacillus sp. MC6.1]|nr:TrbC/VirB2 family protein [Acidithiobacillus sp. MC6.1]